jgi:hypothetical protein
MKASFKNLFLLFLYFGVVAQAQNDGTSRIERCSIVIADH